MRKILYCILFILSLHNVFPKTDNCELGYQNIVVDNNVAAPLWLLENESIYPIQMIQIGDFVHSINDLFVSDSYYRFLLSRAVRKYKQDGNLERFKGAVDAIIQKKNKKILSKFCNKKIIFSTENVKKKINQIADYFQSIGFLDVKVRAQIIKDNSKKIVFLEYFVKTGSQYTIENIHFMCDAKSLLRVVNKSYISSIKPGQKVIYEDLKEERILLFKFLCNKEYWHIDLAQLKFNLCKNKIKKTVDVYMQILVDHSINPQKIKYSTIDVNCFYKRENYVSTIADNKFIKPRILKKVINIKPGDYYSLQQEERFYNYFNNVNVFNSVSFQKNIHGNLLDASLLLSFNHKISISVNPNFLFSSEDIRCSMNVSLKVMNLFHSLDILDVKTSTNFIVYSFRHGVIFKDFVFTANPLFYYPFSHIFNTSNILTTIGSVVNIYPTESSPKQRIQYLIQVLHWQYQILVSDVVSLFTKIVPLEIVKHKTLESNFINPNCTFRLKLERIKYLFMDVVVEAGLNVYQVANPYLKGVLEIIPTIYLSRHMHVSLRGMLGAILRRRPIISENILFKIGGSTTLRGWKESAVGPGDAVVVDKQDRLGDILILLNFENVYRINKFLSINCLFVDVGNIFKNLHIRYISEGSDYNMFFVSKNFWKKLFVDAGGGIRLNWNYFVIRLDIAFIIYNPTKDDIFGERYFPFTPNFNLAFGLPFGNVV